ncbi:MAG: TetR/AcrR family transcriptional regulator [Dehalococcoidia bacterium]
MTTAATTAEQLDPRVLRSRELILGATAELLIECGYGGVTIEGVAERAGEAKTTIYRHWRSKSQLIFDAFESLLQRPTQRPAKPQLREELVTILEGLIRGATASRWAPALGAMVEAGDRDDEVRTLVHDFLAERMWPFRRLLEKAVERGELAATLDVDAAVGMLAGSIFYRRLITREALGVEFAERVVDQFLRGAAHRAGGGGPGEGL